MMSNAKKPTIDSEKVSETTKQQDLPSTDKVTVLNSETETRDLNFRLKAMENTLRNLSQHLESSQATMAKGFEQILTDVQDNIEQGTEEVRRDARDTRKKIIALEDNFDLLEQKSSSLSKETARLALLIQENGQEQADSLKALEKDAAKNFSNVATDIESLDQQVEKLINDYTMLSMETQSLIDGVNDKTGELEQTFSQHQSDFKKLALAIEERNRQVDSQLEQVGRNFQFHDAKIMKLHEKDTELETRNDDLKDKLEQTEAETRQTFTALEQALDKKISHVSEDAQQRIQTLSGKQEKLNADLSQLKETHQQQLSEQKERIDSINDNQETHEQRLERVDTVQGEHSQKLEQLKEVDEELSVRAQHLKKTTDLLNEHSHTLQRTTVSLQEQSNELKTAVNRLDEQNGRLEEKTNDLGLQIAANAQTERQHFQKMTMTISIVAILTIIGLIYSFINQQSLWQSSMDNDVAVERRLNLQLSEHKAQLAEATGERAQLTHEISKLQEQLILEQTKAKTMIQDSTEEIKVELKEMDDNVQFLNNSVGPMKDYTRYTGMTLKDSIWLAKQSGDNYAIQLTSVDSKQELYKYIERNGFALEKELSWFTINSKGIDYFVLTYGSFEDINQARAALRRLPGDLVQASPGIARIRDIQTFIQ
jgi:septal ring-binding cell division protein DamX